MVGSAVYTADVTRYAPHFDALAAVNHAYRDLHRLIVDMALGLPLAPGSSVLEIGAGTGNHILALARSRPEWRVTAADNAPGMLQQLDSKARTRQLDVTLYDGDLNRPWPWRQSQDLILAIHALSWLDHPTQALERACEALSADGRLIVADRARSVAVDSWIASIRQDVFDSVLMATRSHARAAEEAARFFQLNPELRGACRLFDAHAEAGGRVYLSLEGACDELERHGMVIETASAGDYRNHTYLIVARKA